MGKRILSVLLIMLLGISLLTGCKKNAGTPEDNAVANPEETNENTEQQGYLFGYLGVNMANPYFESLQLSISTALENTGNRLITKDPAGNVDTQLQQIQEMIQEGVDAVFLCPVDWEKITPGLVALKDADIAIINVDTEVKDIDLVDAYIGSDNKNAGFVCGDDLLKKRPGGGKILVLECHNRNSIIDRITGFEEAIVDGGFEVVERVDTNGEKETAAAEVQRILEKYSDIDAIMCGNDQMALGALESIEAAGRTGILIYGVDGSPEVKAELAKGNSPIVGTGAQSPISIGKTATETVLAILNKENYEKTVYEKTFFIDKDNVELYGTDGWQ